MINKGDTPHQRLAILKLLLIWEGRLNRARLMELFNLGSNSASVWIREFRELNPEWLVWDTKTRSYHATLSAYKAWRTADPRRLNEAAFLRQYLAMVGLPHASSGVAPGAFRKEVPCRKAWGEAPRLRRRSPAADKAAWCSEEKGVSWR